MNTPNETGHAVKSVLTSRRYQAVIAGIVLLLAAGVAWYLSRRPSAWDAPLSPELPLPGQVYVSVQLTPGKGYTPGAGGIFAVDPEQSARQKISAEVASSVRVAPGGARWAYNLTFNGGVWVSGSDGAKKEIPQLRGIPVWSPDGKRLAISVLKPGSQDARETWLVEVESDKRTKLPVLETDAVEDWSANGNWLLTVSSRPPANGQSYQIYLMHPDGTDPRRLTDGAGFNFAPRFAPDGNRILYIRTEHRKNGLWVVNRDGKDRRLLFETNQDVQACWSPDGKRLAIREQNFQTKEPPRVRIVDADGNNPRALDLPTALWMGAIDWR